MLVVQKLVSIAIRESLCCSCEGVPDGVIKFWPPGGREEGPFGGAWCHDLTLTPSLLLHLQAITALVPQLSTLRTVLVGILTFSHAW